MGSFIAYAIFGILTTVVNIISYHVSYSLLLIPNVPSTILAWTLAVIFAFVTNKLWVFDSPSFDQQTLTHEIPTFLGARISTGILDVLIMYVAVDIMTWPSLLWKCVSNVIVIVLNYVASKLIIFTKSRTPQRGGNAVPVYRVFISSTFKDLQFERQRVKDALLSLYVMPVGMEMFGASDQRPWEIIKRDIDSANCYVLIIGGYFGSEAPNEGISYTQKEFRYARSIGLPVLAFINNDPNILQETDAMRIQKLQAFKNEVEAAVTVDYWENPDHLATKVILALAKYAYQPIYKNPRLDQTQDQTELYMQFRKEITPILKQIVDIDPTAEPVDLDLLTDIEYFLHYWQWPEKKFADSKWEKLRQESFESLGMYYSLFEMNRFHLLEGEKARIFPNNDSLDAGVWLRETLRPQSIKVREKCADIYQRLYA